MICSKCGKQIKDNIKYCPYCGNRIDESTPISNSADEVQKHVEEIPAEVNEYSTEKKDNKKKRKLKVLIITLMLVVFLAILIGSVIIYKNHGSSKKLVKKDKEEKIELNEEDASLDPEYVKSYAERIDTLISEGKYEEAENSIEDLPEEIKNSGKINAEIEVNEYGKKYIRDSNGVCRYIKCDNSEWIYDEEEKLTEVLMEDGDDTFSIYKVGYDENGNAVQFDKYGLDGVVYWSTNLIYEQANVVEVKILNYDDLVLWQKRSFDSNGNIVYEYEYDENEYLEKTHYMEYDDQGRKVKSETYNDKGNLKSMGENHYDSKGNLINNIITFSDGDVSYKEFEYDTNGNMIKSYFYMDYGNPVLSSETEYNHNGDGIKDIYYNNDGTIDFINYYEIEYYPDGTISYKKETTDQDDTEKEYYFEYGLDDKYQLNVREYCVYEYADLF